MSAILTRYNISGQRVLDLESRHVRALSDGDVFLASLSALQRDLDLEPYCLSCASLGLLSSVLVTLQDLHAEFRCRHTAGRIRRDRRLDLEPLLKTLGWNVRCAACGQPVTADNHKTDANFVVACPCTIRSLANPLAHPVDAAAMVVLGLN